MRYCKIILLFALAVCCECCTTTPYQFELLSSNSTGIDFNNLITESDSFNVIQFEYIYNGAGVGVGDVNNDGLTDIFFAGNMVSSRLYLNKGDFKFDDITEEAGVSTHYWCTGVSMIDINQDGRLDIYVCTAHPQPGDKAVNLLFLNKGIDKQGHVKFEEIAEKVGLSDNSYSTQAAFLDYDLDGDMDMYLLTNAIEVYHRNTPVGQDTLSRGKSVDKLFRNEGNNLDGLPVFKDVSVQTNIRTEGWGLGVGITDINQDGYPDIYAANDFLTNDHFYLNNGNGTFTNGIKSMFAHTEHNGMGVDIADINNDGLYDITVTDMMPEDNLRQKTMFSAINYDKFQEILSKNYQPQYVRNVLQLNNGNGSFSEIGYLAGMYATDWSWSTLLADFDNDGWRDMLITNGYKKDITDLDFVTYNKSNGMFGTNEFRKKTFVEETNKLQGVKKPNCLFRNNHDLTFSNKAEEWGLNQPSYTNGAAYADFDNDGDLDIVMNNINDKAFVYKNRLIDKGKYIDKKNNTIGAGNFLRIKLSGKPGNLQGLGAKVSIFYRGNLQVAENNPQRGYKSSVETIIHFGLGNTAVIDSLVVRWQSGNTETLTGITTNQVLILREQTAEKRQQTKQDKPVLFKEVTNRYGLAYKHEEMDFVDFKIQANLLHKHSQQGPGLAVGDLNGDGLDDLFIGGAAHQKAVVFYQNPDNTFHKTDFLDKISEDIGVLLFDVDNDADLDIYCVSGSSEFLKNTQYYQDRLYKNMGNGKFELDAQALPVITASGSIVTASDFDRDGDLDLFVGGRIMPGGFPMPPQSYLLQNNGKGQFTDITAQLSPELQHIGMVTSALWTDFDNDSQPDLIVTGEGMPITFFKNQNGKLLPVKHSGIENLTGFWNSITGADFDNDGDIDYVAGNLGKNSMLQASEKEPVCIYAKDFDENGLIDPIVCRYIGGKEYPVHPRETMTTQLVTLRKKLTTYAAYGNMTFSEIFPEKVLEGALVLRNTYLQSAYIENQGKGIFKLKALPVQVQFSPVFGTLPIDYDMDGNMDLLTVGNDYSYEVLSGWYDTGIGTVLRGDGRGNFIPLKVTETGFFVKGDTKSLAKISLKNGKFLYVVTKNRDSLKAFEKLTPEEKVIKINPDDAYAEVIFDNKKRQKTEFYYANGYLSQSTRFFAVSKNMKEIYFFDFKGNRRKIK